MPARVMLFQELSARGESDGITVSGIDVVDGDSGSIRGAGRGGRFSAELRAPRSGFYAVCAVAERPVRLALRTRDFGGYESEASTWFVVASFRVDQRDDLEFDITMETKKDEEIQVHVFLARAR